MASNSESRVVAHEIGIDAAVVPTQISSMPHERTFAATDKTSGALVRQLSEALPRQSNAGSRPLKRPSGLIPPTSSGSVPAMRRDESVVAAAMRVRRNPAVRLQAGLHNVGGWLGGWWVRRTGAPIADERSRSDLGGRLVERLDRLSAKQKTALVATPYALAAVVAGLLLISGRGETTPVSIAPAAVPTTIVAAVATAPAPAPTPSAPVEENPSAMELTSPAPRSADLSRPTEVERTLPQRALLLVAPKKGSAQVARLRRGSTVLTYPTMPASEGWIVARRPSGEIGFLKLTRLDPPLEIAKAVHPKRVKALPLKKHARGRMLDAPWPR